MPADHKHGDVMKTLIESPTDIYVTRKTWMNNRITKTPEIEL